MALSLVDFWNVVVVDTIGVPNDLRLAGHSEVENQQLYSLKTAPEGYPPSDGRLTFPF